MNYIYFGSCECKIKENVDQDLEEMKLVYENNIKRIKDKKALDGQEEGCKKIDYFENCVRLH